MMKSLRRKLLSAVWIGTVALLPLSPFVHAQDGPPPAGPMHRSMEGHELRFLSRYLDLSDAQKTQIKQLVESQKSAIEPLMLQEHQTHLQMTQLTQSGSFDEAKAQAIAASLSQTSAQITVQRAKVDAQIFQLLTPEQKTKMTQLTTEREQRFADHMQRQENGQPQPPND